MTFMRGPAHDRPYNRTGTHFFGGKTDRRFDAQGNLIDADGKLIQTYKLKDFLEHYKNKTGPFKEVAKEPGMNECVQEINPENSKPHREHREEINKWVKMVDDSQREQERLEQRISELERKLETYERAVAIYRESNSVPAKGSSWVDSMFFLEKKLEAYEDTLAKKNAMLAEAFDLIRKSVSNLQCFMLNSVDEEAWLEKVMTK